MTSSMNKIDYFMTYNSDKKFMKFFSGVDLWKTSKQNFFNDQ